MDQFISKQFKKVSRQEHKLMKEKRESWISYRTRPAREKIEDSIPEKLKETLEIAFYKGFKLVFEKGAPIIDKTYNKEKLLDQHEARDEAFMQTPTRKTFKKVQQRAANVETANTLITTLEGGALGLLGIGIPDIPIFIGMLMKTLREIGLSFGIDTDASQERLYALLLICAALTENEERRRFNHQILLFEKRLETQAPLNMDLEDQIRKTAAVLSQVLLTAKFVQGLPVVGVVGGAVNYYVTKRVANFARLKYKKRYLMSKAVK